MGKDLPISPVAIIGVEDVVGGVMVVVINGIISDVVEVATDTDDEESSSVSALKCGVVVCMNSVVVLCITL